jgi:imidazolonepropionase-like amidohydrolase
MATANGARAIGRAASIGRISPGFDADLIAIPSMATGKNVFAAIVAFDERIRWMVTGGEVLRLR